MSSSVFVSYSRRNQYFALQLVEDLRRAGLGPIWHDQDSIPVNSLWKEKIREAISHHDRFIYLWSPEAQGSEFVQEEYCIAKAQNRDIAILQVSGRAEGDIQCIEANDYEKGLRKVLSWLGVVNAPVGPVDLVKAGGPLSDALMALDISHAPSWIVYTQNSDAAQRRRTFVKFPLLPSGYCTSSLVTESDKDLALLPELCFVLKFTDDEYRDSVQEVLDWLILNDRQPQVVMVEGHKDENGRYVLPEDAPHMWADAVDLISRLIRIFGSGRTLHFFWHAPIALAFATGAQFRVMQKYCVYNLDRDQQMANRYQLVYTGLPQK